MMPEHDLDTRLVLRPAQRRPRRILPGLMGLAVLGLAGAGAWFGATEATNRIEARGARAAQAALADTGLDWAGVEANGLQLILTGTAPDEATRLYALATVGSAVPVAQVMDSMEAAGLDLPPPPPFEVEILANADGISLVGLVPASTDRAAISKRLAGDGATVSDLLASADRPAAENWAPSLAFGLDAVEIAPQAKISIQPGAVTVSAIAPDAEEKARIEQALLAARPDDVALSMDIRAPLPVIAPFTLRYVLEDGAGHLDACAADSPGARDAILAAAGLDAQTDCPLGIGAPSADWSKVAVAAIGALHDLGAGAVTMSDRSLLLEIPASVSLEAQEAAAKALRDGLPPAYRLEVLRITPTSIATEAISFNASLARPGGPVQLRGHITNDQMRTAVETVARARFGIVDSDLKSDDNAPGGWTIRVVAGIEALSRIDAGSVVVTPDLVQVEGVAGNRDATQAVIAGLAERLGEGARYAIRLGYDSRLDPALNLPDGETCVERLNTVLDGAGLRFAPSSAEFNGDIAATLTELGTAMTDCGSYRIEIGGHTDSQGSDDFNAELSQKRAEAVLAAMGEAGIATANLTALGYGESQPLADNDTAQGREQNRRIEMRLVSPEPVHIGPPEPGELVTGVTEAKPEPEAAPEPVPEPEIEPGTGRIEVPEAGAAAPPAATLSPDTEPAQAESPDKDAAPPAASAPSEPVEQSPADDAGAVAPTADESIAAPLEEEGGAAEVPSDDAPGYSAGETPDGGPRPLQRPALD